MRRCAADDFRPMGVNAFEALGKIAKAPFPEGSGLTK
jgi:hypothetical protein